jgi:hypothetical protein
MLFFKIELIYSYLPIFFSKRLSYLEKESRIPQDNLDSELFTKQKKPKIILKKNFYVA